MGKLCLSPLSILFLFNEMKKLFYSLFALVGLFCTSSCVEQQTNYVEGTPVLSVSTELFVADGEDQVVLTVMVGDVDVTDDAKLYADYEEISCPVFTTTRAKDYKFFASYNGKVSNQIVVKAANPKLYLDLPVDTLADKFDNFQHKVLLTQATGTWCGYCPYMIRSIELFRKNGSNAPNTVVVATHSGDELSSPASEEVIASLRVQGFPTSYFSLNPDVVIQNQLPELNAEVLNTTAGMELMSRANVGIAATTAATSNKSMIAVRAAIKVGAKGAYRVNAWLVENGVSASQASYWAEFSDGMSSVLIDHDFILRAASCVSPIQGELLGGKTSCAKGEIIEFYHEFNTKAAGIANADNCKVVVLVTSASGSTFCVDNVIECEVGESVSFAYN